jgi:hypothetical protein
MAQPGRIRGDVVVTTDTGKHVASLLNLEARAKRTPGRPQESQEINDDVYKVAWLRHKAATISAADGGICELTDSDGGVCRAGRAGGARLLAVACWAWADSAPRRWEDLVLRAVRVLEALQAQEQQQRQEQRQEALRLVVAGRGELAEACFGAATGMLRSAQCEQDLNAQAGPRGPGPGSAPQHSRRLPPPTALACVSESVDVSA